jgi:hypothetical protein
VSVGINLEIDVGLTLFENCCTAALVNCSNKSADGILVFKTLVPINVGEHERERT